MIILVKTAEELLLKTFVDREYKLVTRPRPCEYHYESTKCPDGPIEVTLVYNILQILAFAQTDEILNISGWFTVTWRDPRIYWHPEHYNNIKQIFLPKRLLWLPDIGLMNSRQKKSFDFSIDEHSRFLVNHMGNVTWMFGEVSEVTCRLDVTYFPFDSQICYLLVTPWQSTIDHYVLSYNLDGKVVDN
ncbi:hypothetical protein Ciccas_014350, partial [Cichlidogyrus casuarinus]